MSDDDNSTPSDGFAPEGARPVWRDDGTLISGRFDDVYYAIEGGLDETRHVFHGGCDLPARWQDRPVFTIAETGFGTGLNMLATWALFRQAPGRCQRLHVISVEAYPLIRGDLARALADWPELADLSAEFLAAYPPLEQGMHRMVFDQGRFCVTLLFGEAAEMLGQVTGRVDAWFLDGFSPARNPEMWRDAVMDEVARLAAPDAMASSFTVARAVRDRLAARGFTVERAPGFGRKRDMLVARKVAAAGLQPVVTPGGSRIAIIGGGIAGSAMAAALAERGQPAMLFEANPDLSQAASGNPVGIAMPRLQRGDDPIARFNRAAWRFARAWYDRLSAGPDDKPAFNRCGVLQLARTAEELDKFVGLSDHEIVACRSGTVLDGDQVHALTGEPDRLGGLWLPEAGWLRPAVLCQQLRQQAGIDNRAARVARIEPLPEGGWRLLDASGRSLTEAEIVIVANGLDSRQFAPLSWQPLRPKRGQITVLAAAEPEGSGYLPSCIVTFGHYLSPVIDGRRVLGASFDHWPDACPVDWPVPDAASDAGNRRALADWLPQAARHLERVVGHRAGLRATTPDHLPLAGPAPAHDDPQAVVPGLYLLTGLGSTGMVSAPVLAELIAAELFGEPLPLARDERAAVLPARFLLRAARRTPR